jgi:SAM-dependent methyltransferase
MREQRLVFGEVADLYDRHRPSYPARLIDDLVDLAGIDGTEPVLEVGAGTGKATVMFARRGIPVVAIEPSHEMATVARRNCRLYAGVEIEESDFEHWDSRGQRFPLVFSAQAWHWVQPTVGYETARQVLTGRGLLAAFWNRIAWARSNLRDELLDAYRRTAPELAADGPMHPANLCPDETDWEADIASAEGLGDPEVRYYEWNQEHSAADFSGLLGTTSEVRQLDEARRAALFDAVAAVIKAHGEALTLPIRTRLCLARRT